MQLLPRIVHLNKDLRVRLKVPGGVDLPKLECWVGGVGHCFEIASLSRRSMLESLSPALISSTGSNAPDTPSPGGCEYLSVGCAKLKDERQGLRTMTDRRKSLKWLSASGGDIPASHWTASGIQWFCGV